ncbi:MAG: hypothetical protein H3C32_14190 [Anaerolineae bacterium]|nr:hypothetical protein [Anaerolineae bacterium]
MRARRSPVMDVRLAVEVDVASRLRAEAKRLNVPIKTLLTGIIEAYLEQAERRSWPDLSGSIADALSSIGSDDPRPHG